jgi:hypothetical protein
MNLQPTRSGRRGRPPVAKTESRLFWLLAAAFIVVLILFVVLAAQYFVAVLPPVSAQKTPGGAGLASAPSTATALAATTAPTQSPLPSPTPSRPGLRMVCMTQVEEGDWLGKILGQFYVQYRDTDRYYSRECETKDGLLTCGPPELIEVHAAIYPGQWIEMPGVSQTDCLDRDGKTALSEE